MESDSNIVSSEDVNGATCVIPTASTEIKGEMDSFPRFDVVVSGKETDHFWFNRQPEMKPAESSAVPQVQKKIMQEWKILEKNLPGSICVRVYESRIDLMRAAIIGAAGTPYHDGLFFFDIGFPLDYPDSPPLVHYRSFGVRINPNLYGSGKVCLSLLNTWSGKKTERWNPKESTILQVLLSIQALVLNEKPYFNEPGSGMIPGRIFWERKSSAYSEDVFILSCKTMIWLLRRPPMGFETFTAAHFHDRAASILAACHAYASGQAKIGYYGITDGKPDRVAVASERFKASMREVYPILLSAFRREGASVGNFSDQLQCGAVDPANSVEAVEETIAKKQKKKKHGVVDKIFGKLGKLLGLQMMVKRRKKKDNSGSKKKGEVYQSTQVIPKPPEPILVGM